MAVVVSLVTNVSPNAPDVARVEPAARARLALVKGGTTFTLLKDTPVAAPILGVVKTGESRGAKLCVPVGSVRTVLPSASKCTKDAPPSTNRVVPYAIVKFPRVVVMFSPVMEVTVMSPNAPFT